MSNDVARSILSMATASHEQEIRKTSNTVVVSLFVSMSDDAYDVSNCIFDFDCTTMYDEKRYYVDIKYHKEDVEDVDLAHNKRTEVRSRYVFPACHFPVERMRDAVKAQFTEFVCDTISTINDVHDKVMNEEQFECMVEYSYSLLKNNTTIMPFPDDRIDITSNFLKEFPIVEMLSDDVRVGLEKCVFIDELFDIVWGLVKRQVFLATYTTTVVTPIMKLDSLTLDASDAFDG